MANGLGFTTEPPVVKRVSKQASINIEALPPVVDTAAGLLRYTGLVPTLLVFAAALTLPILLMFDFLDFGKTSWTTASAVVYITFPAIGALIFLITPAISILYAAALGFHTATESFAATALLHVGTNGSVVMPDFMGNPDFYESFHMTGKNSSDLEIVLAWVGLVLVIVHMLPFYFLRPQPILRILAAVGVIVNSAVGIYVTKLWSLYLLFNGSAMFLLTTMLLFDGDSIFGMFVKSIRTGTFIMTPMD